MASYNEARTLIKRFDLIVSHFAKVQHGVYRLTLNNGKIYVLKRMPVSLKTLHWIDKSLHTFQRKGFNKLGWRRLESVGKQRLYAQLRVGGTPYILAPWITGRWPNIKSAKDMKDVGIKLAHFHKVGQNIRLPKNGAVNKVSQWPSMLRSQHMLVSNVINRSIERKKLLPIDHILRKHGLNILGYARMAQHILKRHAYLRKYESHQKLITLCHGDVGPTNFIINKNGVHFIDFETLQVNFRALDLSRAIYNSCKDHNWKFSIAKAFLDGYQSVSKLERADFIMLHMMLRFPQTTYLLLRHYQKTNTSGKKQVVKELPRAVLMEKKITTFLSQLDRYRK